MKLFNEPVEGAHRALADVRACVRCYFELKRLKVMTLPLQRAALTGRPVAVDFSDLVRARGNSEAIVRFRVLVHQDEDGVVVAEVPCLTPGQDDLAIRGLDGEIGLGDTIQNDRHADLRSDVVLALGA